MKPKVLVIVLLALVALFVFSTTSATSRRGVFSGPLVSILTSQPTLVSRISERLDQPVPPGEIILAEGDQNAGCTWDGKWLSVPPSTACHFTILVGRRAWWQFNSSKQLKLRLVGIGASVNVTMARARQLPAGENPQVATLQNPTGQGPAALPFPGPGAWTPAAPTPTPTPAQFTVYDQDNRGQDWLLTLDNCQISGEGPCQVELVE